MITLRSALITVVATALSLGMAATPAFRAAAPERLMPELDVPAAPAAPDAGVNLSAAPDAAAPRG